MKSIKNTTGTNRNDRILTSITLVFKMDTHIEVQAKLELQHYYV